MRILLSWIIRLSGILASDLKLLKNYLLLVFPTSKTKIQIDIHINVFVKFYVIASFFIIIFCAYSSEIIMYWPCRCTLTPHVSKFRNKNWKRRPFTPPHCSMIILWRCIIAWSHELQKFSRILVKMKKRKRSRSPGSEESKLERKFRRLERKLKDGNKKNEVVLVYVK